MPEYDLLVVGGGTAGLVTAAGSAGLGARVALVERERLGGECLWNGCVPSKALIAAARTASAARASERYGVGTGPVTIDFTGVMRWVLDAQQTIAPHDSPERFQSLGVDVIKGEARFTGERAISVDGKPVTAKRIVLATGSSPLVPPIPGLAEVPYLTNENIFALTSQPAKLLILGGGPIGLEMAQAFARLGTEVHVVEAASQLLPREDAEMAARLASALAAEGIRIHLGTKASRVDRSPDGRSIRMTCTVEPGDGKAAAGHTVTFEGDTLLVATGRAPRTDSLDLAKGGVEAGRGGITVNDHLQTTADQVWAAGDCVGPLRFTHVADYQARLVIRNAFFPFAGKANYDTVPWVTYTDPELAHVGLTESEARERHGDDVQVWRREFADVDRAVTDGHTGGLVKLITASRGRIVGGHVLGYGAGNIIGEITLAMKHGISASALGGTMHAYPTYPEAVKQAAEGYTKSRFKGVIRRTVNWWVRR